MQSEDLVGQTLGHYQIKRQIGYGGMATVFLAEDVHLNREIALKVFWPRPGETQDFLHRFGREARVLAQLDHPNILPVYDYGEQGEMAYLVTPYLSGGTLKELLQERKALPSSEALTLFAQILPALQYAHERKFIHRDIKPANLLFKADGTLVLADFGLVKVVQNEDQADSPMYTLTQNGQLFAGTPEYMAPEQIEGNAVAASDIYALGIVLYEMVTGVRPFTGNTLLSILMKQVHEVPPPPHLHNRYITPQLEAAILRALEKDANKRFACPADFQQALNESMRRIGNPASNPGIINSSAGTTSANQGTMATVPSESGPTVERLPASNQLSATNQPLMTEPALPKQAPLVFPVQQPPKGPLTPVPPMQPWMPLPDVTFPPTIPVQTTQKSARTPIILLLVLLVLLISLVSSLFLTPFGSHLLASRFSPSVTAIANGTVPTTSPAINTFTPNATTPSVGTGSPEAPGNITQPMPTTQTTCPSPGTARAAITAHLVLGQQPTLVYIVNEHDSSGNPTFGTVKVFNLATGKKTELIKTNSTVVDEAQVSNDGEWVLFAATIAGRSQLRLVRLDGTGLQTLFCAAAGTTIHASQWSLDQKHIIFEVMPQLGAPTLYLLSTRTGNLQVEVSASTSGLSLMPRVWLDNNHVLLTGLIPNSDVPPQNVYLLDIRNGANQSLNQVQKVFDSAGSTCWDFDNSYDGQTLFAAQCTPSQPTGSSMIVQQAVAGGTPTSVLTSSTLSLSMVRVIDPHNASLLALASDVGPSSPNGDVAHDGLYLVKTDGSAPVRLTSTPSGQDGSLTTFSQYFWSNISRDGNLYAFQTVQPGTNVYTLMYGSLSGGTPTIFASIANTALAIAGWTTT